MGAIVEAAFCRGICLLMLYCVLLPLGLILLGYLGVIFVETIWELWRWRRKK